jgi:methylglutaconyl-CoA hydratase
MSESVLVERRGRVAVLTLNRPERRNALNPEMSAALRAAALDAGRDADVRVIELTGAGEAFCAGADLAHLQRLATFSPAENEADSRALMEMFAAVRFCPKPVVARVNGHAIAGGCGLALCCDIVAAAAGAKLGFTEVRIGFVPAIVMRLAVDRAGASRARDLLLRGHLVEAAEAMRLGLVDHVAPRGDLDALADGIADEIASACSPQALAFTKRLLDDTAGLSLRDAMERGVTMNAMSRGTRDFQEGVRSFLEKRPPRWDEDRDSPVT